MATDYGAWLKNARAALTELQRQKDSLRAQQESLRLEEQEVDRQINGMAQTVSGLASLVPAELPEPSLMGVLELVGKTIVDVGITNRIRAILKVSASRQFSAVEVRDELRRTGFYVGEYANALATIYTTLRRMVVAGDVVEHAGGDGRRYQWNPVPSALRSLPNDSDPRPVAVLKLPPVEKVASRRRRIAKKTMRRPVVPTPPSGEA
ncbi:hypothetical protein [Paludibaculum fermentans]|uniref:hypothetical protein n=1 Tax=Paludibaculum fermentans TaxID=1473598 RepID=UPI003EBCA915